ncbi:MAG: ribonuclease Z [Nitrospinota bacterium]
MKVTILGSGTAVPSLQRNSSGVLIQDKGVNSLVDFGYGNLKQLLNLGITYHDIDRIFFTHNHPDHMCDLIPFLFGTRYQPDARKKDLEIVAGPGFKDFFDKLMQAFKHWLKPTEYKLDIVEIDEGDYEFGALRVKAEKVKHIAMSRGYRFADQNGKSVALSGDTDYCEGMINLGKETDLMILECAWPDEEKTEGHLGPTLAGKLAAEANCKKLCLTHFYPPCDLEVIRKTVQETYKGELVLARDLMQFDL